MHQNLDYYCLCIYKYHLCAFILHQYIFWSFFLKPLSDWLQKCTLSIKDILCWVVYSRPISSATAAGKSLEIQRITPLPYPTPPTPHPHREGPLWNRHLHFHLPVKRSGCQPRIRMPAWGCQSLLPPSSPLQNLWPKTSRPTCNNQSHRNSAATFPADELAQTF